MKKVKKTMFSIFCLLGMLLVFTLMEILPQKGETTKNRPPLELRYIANEGIMVSSTTGKVLIDALFKDPHPNYNAPAEDTLKMILEGHPPFDNITLVLVTHNHQDHFEASLTVKFLENQTGSFLAAPADVVMVIKEMKLSLL